MKNIFFYEKKPTIAQTPCVYDMQKKSSDLYDRMHRTYKPLQLGGWHWTRSVVVHCLRHFLAALLVSACLWRPHDGLQMAPAVEYLIDVYPEYVPIDGLPLDTLQEKVSKLVHLSLAAEVDVSRFEEGSQGPHCCLQVLTNGIGQVRPYKSVYLHHSPYKSSWS